MSTPVISQPIQVLCQAQGCTVNSDQALITWEGIQADQVRTIQLDLVNNLNAQLDVRFLVRGANSSILENADALRAIQVTVLEAETQMVLQPAMTLEKLVSEGGSIFSLQGLTQTQLQLIFQSSPNLPLSLQEQSLEFEVLLNFSSAGEVLPSPSSTVWSTPAVFPSPVISPTPVATAVSMASSTPKPASSPKPHVSAVASAKPSTFSTQSAPSGRNSNSGTNTQAIVTLPIPSVSPVSPLSSSPTSQILGVTSESPAKADPFPMLLLSLALLIAAASLLVYYLWRHRSSTFARMEG